MSEKKPVLKACFAEKSSKIRNSVKEPSFWEITEDLKVVYFDALRKHEAERLIDEQQAMSLLLKKYIKSA